MPRQQPAKEGAIVGFPVLDRRSLLKYASVSGLASLATACLSQNAPTTATATATAAPGIGQPATAQPVQQPQAVTLKFQSGFSPQDLFHEMLILWGKKVEA
ncbi:MAG: hypothetical protein AAB114_03900, partial [Chloroflexota bacterium]